MVPELEENVLDYIFGFLTIAKDFKALSTKLCCFELLFSEKPYLVRIPAFQINKKSALSQDAHRERVSGIARADLA
jgi:hypothetical protein